MAKPEALEVINISLRALIALIAERDRRDGATINEIATVLGRSGMPHAEIAALLGSTPDGVRVAIQRGRKKNSRQTRRKEENGLAR